MDFFGFVFGVVFGFVFFVAWLSEFLRGKIWADFADWGGYDGGIFGFVFLGLA